MADHDIVCAYGGIRFSDTLSENAKPNSEFEAHAHHDEMEIYWFLEGNLVFAFEGDRIPVTPGDMVVICNGMLHRPVLKSICRYYRRRILFRKELLLEYCPAGIALYRKLRTRRILRISGQGAAEAGLDKLFWDVAGSLSEETPLGSFRSVTALCYFLLTADRVCAPEGKGEAVTAPGKAQALIRYIEDHLAEELSYQTLSEYANLSIKSLYQFFKQETGFPLGQYIKESRIIKAKTLLNAGASAAEAAAGAGFKDYSVFYRNFQKKTGLTPAEYLKTAERSNSEQLSGPF